MALGPIGGAALSDRNASVIRKGSTGAERRDILCEGNSVRCAPSNAATEVRSEDA